MVTQIRLSELIDHPQLVLSTADNRAQVGEYHRWAEPLRRRIPGALATLLGSSRIVSVPVDGQGFDADFCLLLDVQPLEALPETGGSDVPWWLEPPTGKDIVGPGRVREPIGGGDAAALVAAKRRALVTVVSEIAERLCSLPGGNP